MNFIGGQIFDLFGKLISCVVTSAISFQYFDKRYFRTYRLNILYPGVGVMCCIINLIVCLLEKPALNLGFWLLAVTLIGRFLYYDEILSPKKYFLTNMAYVFAYSICESVGAILVNAGRNMINANPGETVISFIYSVSGAASGILLYYFILQKLFLGEKTQKISVRQYTIYAAIAACTLLNIGEILFLAKYELDYRVCIFLILDGAFIIIINLYLLHVLNALTENKDLKYKLDLYERQARSNYEYYIRQMESRKTVLAVIHDIEKHVRVLQELKGASKQEEIGKYMGMFEDLATPLMFDQYCNNVILNVIINDKMDYCRKNKILFETDIQEVQIDFMRPVDITTVFGNILDNAVVACEKSGEKWMSIKILPFNGFVFVQLANTFSGQIFWDGRGMPISQKGDRHGIGLENVKKVLKDYCGEIQFKAKGNVFTIEMMFNHP